MTFLIAALNIILVGSFWIRAGSASHTFTPRNKGLLTYLSVFGRLMLNFILSLPLSCLVRGWLSRNILSLASMCISNSKLCLRLTFRYFILFLL